MHKKILGAVLAVAVIVVAIAGCGATATPQKNDSGKAVFENVSDTVVTAVNEAVAENKAEEKPSAPEIANDTSYPRAWLAADAGGLPAGTLVEVLSFPGQPTVPHVNGKTAEGIAAEAPVSEANAVIRQLVLPTGGGVRIGHGEAFEVSADLLMLNLPDYMPDAVYAGSYSSATPSDCAGRPIPGVTGEVLAGYPNGPQFDAYLAKTVYATPAAYRTYLKLLGVQESLNSQGYPLCFYDVYRPWEGTRDLADGFAAAYQNDPVIQEALGSWSLAWYVADELSGHNYGTDVDCGVADAATGTELPMPSHFDALDDSGHLCAYPMNESDITEAAYTDAVSSNPACLALHRAMVAAGFTELASEWWHFGDYEGQGVMSGLMSGGNFTAWLA